MQKDIHCERCGKRHLGDAVFLEFNYVTTRWHKPGDVPAKESQGGFWFGRQCAEKALQDVPFKGKRG